MQKTIFLLGFVLLLCLQVQAQFVVQGTVVDGIGEGLISAAVLEQGTNNGTVTDLDGKFELEVSDSLAILVISYTGFDAKKIAIEGKKVLKISLSEGANLEEVVITSYRRGNKSANRSRSYGKSNRSAKIRESSSYRTAPIRRTPNRSSRTTTRTQTKQRPTRNMDHLAMKSKKMASANEGRDVSVRGSRTDGTDYYIDGKRVSSSWQRSTTDPVSKGEDYGLITENSFHTAKEEPQSTFSIDVDAASYSNMRRFLNRRQQPPKDAIRIEEMINYFEYEYPEPSAEQPFEVVTEIAECPWQKEHYLLHVGLQGQKIKTENLPASNLVFLVDVSGSMSSHNNKLPLLKSSFELLVEQMRPQDRVAIVVYASAAGLVLPSTSGADKATILAALHKLKSGGSTAGGQGIKLAYKIAKENFIEAANNRVILATDGDFNVGASSDADMVRLIEEERKSGVFLTVLGFGMDNYKEEKMQQLANKGNGNHAYIDGLEEAKKVLVSEFGGMFTIAKDVKIQIEFNPEQVAGYRLIGYENRLLANEDFEDDTKDAGELGAGHTVTALYEIIPKGLTSSFLKSTPTLKYQKEAKKTKGTSPNEFATIALRYKKPDGDTSQLIEKSIVDAGLTLDNTSDNFRFSAAVASFGMLLRNSDFKGNASYASALELAKAAQGNDEKGYREDFMTLIQKAQALEASALEAKR